MTTPGVDQRPPPGERTFRIRRYECDAYGHVNNTTYLRYLEELEVELGLEANDEITLRSTDIEYLEPRAFGGEIRVSAQSGARPSERTYTYHDR